MEMFRLIRQGGPVRQQPWRCSTHDVNLGSGKCTKCFCTVTWVMKSPKLGC
jgi:hypothetical protein